MSRTIRNVKHAHWHRHFKYRHKLGESGKTTTDWDDVPVAALKETHRSKLPKLHY